MEPLDRQPDRLAADPVRMDLGRAEPSRSIGDLIGDLIRDLRDLVTSEGKLVRAEIAEAGRSIAAGAEMIGAGAVLLLVALLVLVQAGVVALAAFIGPMWASLMVGILLAIVAVVLIQTGRSKLKTSNLVPERTIEQTSRDARLARDQI